ncbi:hypothetical protein SPRG_04345 [Saprolegnia parasitica CBS 223.65]|uniref:Tudor domain-containing protein n=1 Tax=Saprolegnia parasitica (strain CBS 223.65) TaxID=695850 RepID=A0A067CIT7_SAPPC|nr:hypothetical protein SPRG_04345 [Saprolegnia parasitica CBS 223.65]KDO30443.1 hypothetical protein SPRG_04345 [Saprolegnia parasitica CBS 223.65]|eukprot:XP_012198665.1 hypothetical protein SPRG_04345 [Saprolegnia parasitica CBS 223.65]
MSAVHDTGGLVGIKVLVPHAGDVVAFDAETQRYEVRFVTGLVMKLPRDEVLNLNQMSVAMQQPLVVQHPLVGTCVVKRFNTTLVRGTVQQHDPHWNVFEVLYDNGLRDHVAEEYIRAHPYVPVVVKVEPPDDCIDLTLSDDETPIKTEQPPRLPPSLAPLDVLPVAYKPPSATPVASVAPTPAPPVANVASFVPAIKVASPEHRVVEWSGSESDVSPPPKQFTRLTKAKPRQLRKAGRRRRFSESSDASSPADESTSDQDASSSSSDEEEEEDPRAIKDELAATLLKPVEKNRRAHCHVRHKKANTEAIDTARRRKQAKRTECTPPPSPVSEPKRQKKTAAASVPELARPRSNVRQLKPRPPDASPTASKPSRKDVTLPLVTPQDMDTEFTIPRKQASSQPPTTHDANSRSKAKYTAGIFHTPSCKPHQRPADRAHGPRGSIASTHNTTRAFEPHKTPMRQKKKKLPPALPAGWDTASNASNRSTASHITSNYSGQPLASPRPVMSKPVPNFTAQGRVATKGLMPDYELKKVALAAERQKSSAQLAPASSEGRFVALGRKHQPKFVPRRPSKDDVTAAPFEVPTASPEAEPPRYLAREPRPIDEFRVSV